MSYTSGFGRELPKWNKQFRTLRRQLTLWKVTHDALGDVQPRIRA
jgi:hypothetical protein